MIKTKLHIFHYILKLNLRRFKTEENSYNLTKFLHHIKHKYGSPASRETRAYLNLLKKLHKCRLAIEFIKLCRKDDILPKFTQFKIANPKLNKSRFIYSLRRQISKIELNNKLRRQKALRKTERKILGGQLFNFSNFDTIVMKVILNSKLRPIINKVQEKHRSKLERLGLKTFTYNINSILVDSSRNNLDSINLYSNKKRIYNESNRKLTQPEIDLLNKGLKFGIRDKKVNEFELLSRFELLSQRLHSHKIAESTDERKTRLDNNTAFLKSLQTFAFDFVELSKKADDNLNQDERKALEDLSKDPTIIITKADKGEAVVIQNVCDYKSKIAALLMEDGKFLKLEIDDTCERETKLQNKLRYLSNKGAVTRETYKRVSPCGSKSGILYGLPKIHKQGVPIRPIISAIGTYTYKLSKYLDEIIKPILVEDHFMAKDTFDFVNLISEQKLESHNYMVSFDVSSLFTNVPVTETIEIILNRCFVNKDDKFHGLSRRQLKELLEVCVQKCIFKFDGEYYEQIDGVSMGNPLGPLFANVFMAELESKNMDRLKSLGVVFWIRYVDDIFAILKSETCAEQVLSHLNIVHSNIKFTTEVEKNNSIPFLDVLVKRKKGRLHTEMYRKTTFTGVYLNWYSLTSKKYKLGLINCLLDRIWKICSDPEIIDLEVKRTKSILLTNNYPLKILDEHIARFVRKKKNLVPIIDPNEYKLNATDVPKDEIWLKLPFYGPDADEFGCKFENFVNSNFRTTKLCVVFTTPTEIGKNFKFKDRVDELEKQSLIVYQISCSQCEASYIGKTERIFTHRLKEHSRPKVNSLDNNKTSDSAVYNHHLETGHIIDYNSTKILDRADSDRKLQIKELLHIDQKKPTLNIQLNSQSEFRINVNIIGTKK